MDNMNQPKPVHKTNWMVIILLVVICVVVALGIWWWTNDTAKIASLEQQVAQSEVKTNGTTVTPSVTPTATATPTPTATPDQYAGWKTYTDNKLKIEFKYPSDWNGIDAEARKCDNPSMATKLDPCEHVSLIIPSFKAISIAASQSVLYTMYPIGRGGYWGDEVTKITDLNSVNNYCKNTELPNTKCRVYQNANGVTVARSVERDCNESGCHGEAVMYYVKLDNSIFPAIVFSTAGLKDTTIVDVEGKMDKLVDSLKLL